MPGTEGEQRKRVVIVMDRPGLWEWREVVLVVCLVVTVAGLPWVVYQGIDGVGDT